MRRLADLAGGLAGLRVAVLGRLTASGVKETAFSGVFAVAASSRSGAAPSLGA